MDESAPIVIGYDGSEFADEALRKGLWLASKLGVPALYLKSGVDFVGQPAGYGQKKIDEYTERDYHKVTDEVKPDWDMSGGVEDLRLLLDVGWNVANTTRWPEWKAGSEFKARRDEMLKGAGLQKP